MRILAAQACELLLLLLAFDAFGRLFAVDNDPDSRGPCRLLHIVEGGDHSFKVLKRSGRTEADVMTELVQAIVGWARKLVEDGEGG